MKGRNGNQEKWLMKERHCPNSVDVYGDHQFEFNLNKQKIKRRIQHCRFSCYIEKLAIGRLPVFLFWIFYASEALCSSLSGTRGILGNPSRRQGQGWHGTEVARGERMQMAHILREHLLFLVTYCGHYPLLYDTSATEQLHQLEQTTFVLAHLDYNVKYKLNVRKQVVSAIW